MSEKVVGIKYKRGKRKFKVVVIGYSAKCFYGHNFSPGSSVFRKPNGRLACPICGRQLKQEPHVVE